MRMLSLLALLLLAPLAMAQGLTTERAENFIDSLVDVTDYSETLDEEVLTGGLDNDFMPERGAEFAPYSRAMESMQANHADAYEGMSNIVSSYDFASAQEWAETGDRVAIAYMALHMEGTEMEQVTPEMLEQVPPAMRPQIERALAIMETVRNAPAEDIEVIRPLAGRLNEYMGGIQPSE